MGERPFNPDAAPGWGAWLGFVSVLCGSGVGEWLAFASVCRFPVLGQVPGTNILNNARTLPRTTSRCCTRSGVGPSSAPRGIRGSIARLGERSATCLRGRGVGSQSGWP